MRVFLRSALVAIIEKFTVGDPLEPPTKVEKPRQIEIEKVEGHDLWQGRGRCSLNVPFNDLPQEIRDAFLNGTKRRITFRHGDYKFERDWQGALRAMRERLENPPSEKIKTALEELIAPMPCPVCNGMRLQPESLAVKVNGLGIADYTELPISEACKKFDAIKLSPRDEKIAGLVLKEIEDRLRFLDAVGLGYLTLESLFGVRCPGGEGQRIRLGDADRIAASRRAVCS